jgi:hypothetical protein
MIIFILGAVSLGFVYVHQCFATEVYVVGIYAPGNKDLRSIPSGWVDMDWPLFCATLSDEGKKKTPSPANRLWGFLDPDVQKIVADRDMIGRMGVNNGIGFRNGKPDDEAISAWLKIRSGIEKALNREDFYEEKTFATLSLDAQTHDLISRIGHLSPVELRLLNRRLLDAAFPNAIKPSFLTLKDITVRVHVRPTKEAIVLVLSSYESVRWKIEADENAKIEKVIVGGYYIQDVVGTNVPVSYHVWESPPDPKTGRKNYFYAYQQSGDDYARLLKTVQELTSRDQEITSFQGSNSYQGGPPFVVGGD